MASYKVKLSLNGQAIVHSLSSVLLSFLAWIVSTASTQAILRVSRLISRLILCEAGPTFVYSLLVLIDLFLILYFIPDVDSLELKENKLNVILTLFSARPASYVHHSRWGQRDSGLFDYMEMMQLSLIKLIGGKKRKPENVSTIQQLSAALFVIENRIYNTMNIWYNYILTCIYISKTIEIIVRKKTEFDLKANRCFVSHKEVNLGLIILIMIE